MRWLRDKKLKNSTYFHKVQLKERNFEKEFRFRTSRSSGAGGQHVNTTETKVELIFSVADSVLLNQKEKEIILNKLKKYINEQGELRLSSSKSRSQSTNKELAIKRFYTILEKAIKKEKKRIPTKMPKEVKDVILKSKKLHSQKKSERSFKTKDWL